MTLQWESKEAHKNRQVPIVAYERTKLTLNGERLENSELIRNNVGAISISDKKGINRLTIAYEAMLQTKIGIFISVLAWSGTILALSVYAARRCF